MSVSKFIASVTLSVMALVAVSVGVVSLLIFVGMFPFP